MMVTLAVGVLVVARASVSMACAVAADCDDRNVCNGFETCDAATGQCLPGTPLNCDDGNPCTVDSCEPSAGGCVHPVTGNAMLCYVAVIDEQLAQADTLLRGTKADKLSGPSTKRRLIHHVVTMRRLLEKVVRPADPARGAFAARWGRVCHVSARLRTLVLRDESRGTFDTRVAQSLLALVPDCFPRLPPPFVGPPLR